MKNVYHFKNNKWTKKETILRFLFLLYPIKIRNGISFLLIIALLIAFGMIISLFTIPFFNTGIKIGFTWLPTIIAGWIFGPLPGLIIGAVIDTLCFLINGGIWFWLYAIQEPLVGFIAGIFGFIFLILKLKTNGIKIGFIFSQCIIHSFLIVTFLTLFLTLHFQYNLFQVLYDKDKLGSIHLTTLLILVGILLGIFYIVIQTINIIQYKWKSKNYYFFIVASLCILLTFIFSFLLGPISTIEFYKYINGKQPNSFIKYGHLYYLIPRIVKESFKTPIYIILLSSLILVIDIHIKKVKLKANNVWGSSKD